MAKKRHKDHRGLPRNWRFKHGAYRYRVPVAERHLWDGKTEANLGTNLHDAYRTWADRHQFIGVAKTMNDLFDRYVLEVISTRRPGAAYQARLVIDRLRLVFGDMLPHNLKPVHIYQYNDLRSVKKKLETGRVSGGPGAAKKDITMLSDVCNYAVRWGVVDRHPFQGQVKIQKEKTMQHYVEDEDIQAFNAVTPTPTEAHNITEVMKLYVEFKLLTGLRKQDALLLPSTILHDNEDGIFVQPQKTSRTSGKAIIIEWTHALRDCVVRILAARPNQSSEYLFCHDNGTPWYDINALYTARDFSFYFTKHVKRAMAECGLKQRFVDKNLRAKVATDLNDTDHAQNLLAHTTKQTTQNHYIVKPQRVKPTK